MSDSKTDIETGSEPGSKPPKAELVGDLETLRTLLDKDDPTLDMFADQAPVVVPEHSTSANDTLRKDTLRSDSRHSDPNVAHPNTTVPTSANSTGDLFADVVDDVLGERWQQQADNLLSKTRELIEEQKLDWNPHDTDSLTQALKVRLDQSLHQWLRELLDKHLQDLHQTLLQALEDELQQRIHQTLNTNATERAQKEAGLSQLADT